MARDAVLPARALHTRGLEATIFELEPDQPLRPQGGILDIHDDTGQRAIRDAVRWGHKLTAARPVLGVPGRRELDLDGRASVTTAAAWRQTVVTWTKGTVQAAHDEWAELPPVWRRASKFNDYLCCLTPAQAAGVLDRFDSMLRELSADSPYDAFPVEAGDHPDGVVDRDELREGHQWALTIPGRLPHGGEK